jgi:hypothetical protein
VDPTAGLGKARADIPAEEAKQPKDEQDYDDGPQHEISPFLNERMDASRSRDRWQMT